MVGRANTTRKDAIFVWYRLPSTGAAGATMQDESVPKRIGHIFGKRGPFMHETGIVEGGALRGRELQKQKGVMPIRAEKASMTPAAALSLSNEIVMEAVLVLMTKERNGDNDWTQLNDVGNYSCQKGSDGARRYLELPGPAGTATEAESVRKDLAGEPLSRNGRRWQESDRSGVIRSRSYELVAAYAVRHGQPRLRDLAAMLDGVNRQVSPPGR